MTKQKYQAHTTDYDSHMDFIANDTIAINAAHVEALEADAIYEKAAKYEREHSEAAILEQEQHEEASYTGPAYVIEDPLTGSIIGHSPDKVNRASGANELSLF